MNRARRIDHRRKTFRAHHNRARDARSFTKKILATNSQRCANDAS
jgi:hypothetical protein